MPLERDMHSGNIVSQGKAEEYVARQQQKRSQHLDEPGHPVRPDTPQNESRESVHSHRPSSEQPHPTVKAGKHFALEEDIDVANLKIAPPTTVLPHSQTYPFIQRNVLQMVPSHQVNAAGNKQVEKSQMENNAFDNTESLDFSYEEENYGNNETAIYRPQPHGTSLGRKKIDNGVYSKQDSTDAASDPFNAIKAHDPAFSRITHAGRDVAAARGFVVDNRAQSPLPKISDGPNGMDRRYSVGSDTPDTPSRPQSAPVRNEIKAPKPQKAVTINTSPLFMQSPTVRSGEIAREETPDPPFSRPSSAHTAPRSFPLQHRSHQNPPAQSRLRQSHPAHSARFQEYNAKPLTVPIRDHDQKVSAVESDVHESSEDEGNAHVEKIFFEGSLNGHKEKRDGSRQKRTHEQVPALDYDQADLKKKTLDELQKEPFIQDLRNRSEPPRDSMGNDLTLSQILDKWSKVTDEALRDMFRVQNDDDWAKTGQWFVDSFQTDLKELMQVRVDRRKVALSFENKIRQRQKEIEHYRAGLDRELKELQEGGNGLLKDRKTTAGSRSNTPMKPARSH